MKFQKVCDKLGIGKYAERIFHSNSHGELFFIYDYMGFLEIAEKDESFAEWFPKWFESVVEWAEKEWQRPDSVFQHMPKLMQETLSA